MLNCVPQVVRAYLTVPLHCTTAFLMGGLVTRGRLDPTKHEWRERWYARIHVHVRSTIVYSRAFCIRGQIGLVLEGRLNLCGGGLQILFASPDR